jgi:dTDP-4-dehydrorhamnose 3,5-epimerase
VIFTPTALAGAVLIDPTAQTDGRGQFTRIYCAREFAAHGIALPVAQCSVSSNTSRGTLRGLHYQTAPHGEAKLVRCSRGAIHDVIVDIRASSPQRGQHLATLLSQTNARLLFIPEGFAHGFQTLTDDTVVDYMMSTPYEQTAAAGLRWNDPTLAIAWPISEPILSERDRELPRWRA